jgi:hypothetical protein
VGASEPSASSAQLRPIFFSSLQQPSQEPDPQFTHLLSGTHNGTTS